MQINLIFTNETQLFFGKGPRLFDRTDRIVCLFCRCQCFSNPPPPSHPDKNTFIYYDKISEEWRLISYFSLVNLTLNLQTLHYNLFFCNPVEKWQKQHIKSILKSIIGKDANFQIEIMIFDNFLSLYKAAIQRRVLKGEIIS